jgi:hypothetical protein
VRKNDFISFGAVVFVYLLTKQDVLQSSDLNIVL